MFELIEGPLVLNRYRLSIHTDWESSVNVELRDPGIKPLLYSKYQLVEVFDMEKTIFCGQVFNVKMVLEIMTSLVHLRYLGVSVEHATNILSRATNLKNLETLIIFNKYHRCLPFDENFWRMERLRHLDVGDCCFTLIPTKFEAYLPMYNLECFSTLVLKPVTSTNILQRLPNLRKLSCKYFKDPYESNDLILALDVLNKLESLKLELLVVVNVTLPATLKKLSLCYRGSILPSQLGELPRLEVLKLQGHRIEKWDIEPEEFPMLKFLKLTAFSVREWNVSDDSFPRLEQLVFALCDRLHDIPASFQESTTLKKIKVLACSSRLANSATEIRDEQNDLGNEIELIILE